MQSTSAIKINHTSCCSELNYLCVMNWRQARPQPQFIVIPMSLLHLQHPRCFLDFDHSLSEDCKKHMTKVTYVVHSANPKRGIFNQKGNSVIKRSFGDKAVKGPVRGMTK